MATKICSRCGEDKPFVGFSVDKRNQADGHTSACKECIKKGTATRKSIYGSLTEQDLRTWCTEVVNCLATLETRLTVMDARLTKLESRLVTLPGR